MLHRPSDPLEIREDLAIVLLAGYLHDVNSPLAALQANVGIARELLEDLGRRPETPALAELQEVFVDMDEAAARLMALAADLRTYVGTSSAALPVVGQVGAAVRLARSHLSRRASVSLTIDPSLRAASASGELTRALGAVIVALTRGLEGSRLHRVAITGETDGLVVTIDPPPPEDVGEALRAAVLRLPDVALDVRSTETALTVRLRMGWAP